MIRKIIIILCIITLGILSGCNGEEPPPPDKITYRAFLVGVGDYLFFSSADLSAPAYNVERLENLFNKCKFGEEEIEFVSIKKLVDHNATKENILNGIASTFGEAKSDDVSYFYYMGHGGVKDGIPVVTPTETKFTLETSITVHELESALSAISGIKVVFIESCHSGNFIDRGQDNFNKIVINIFKQKTRDLINKENYQVLTSSKGEQYSWVHGIWSYFCRALLLGCQELNADTDGDEVVDLTELYIYIQEWVTENLSQCKEQDVQIYPDNSTFPIVEY